MSLRAGQGQRIVIAGGGVAALEAAIALRSIAGPAPSITLVAPNAEFVYQPLSVGEPFALGPAPRLPLADFADDLELSLRTVSIDAVGNEHAVLFEGGFVAFDKLIVAIGAPRVPAYTHATTFRGDADTQAVHGLVQDLEMGLTPNIVFVVPRGVAWSLPIYELALMAARRAWETQVETNITIVTPEDRPLGVFGAAASADVTRRLEDAGIRVLCSSAAEIPKRGLVIVQPRGETIEAERVIALPVTQGPRLAGLPSDDEGFIPIDTYARVTGAPDVYAAGDGTNFPLKQGGIACQQADAAAEHIAWSMGLGARPEPFRPVLRGRLLTGTTPQFMRHDVSARGGGEDASAERPLWWPATKIAGRYLSAYLSEKDGTRAASQTLAPGVKRVGFIAPSEGQMEMPLRGWEYAGRWSAPAED